ncbi:MAG TPA: hypothetical protein G4O13_07210 [Dehalococcoidia bacterium]|nr:hypothetical protein [Dehalococcoidia bacterium]
MVWKRFSQGSPADKHLNEAEKHWRNHQNYLLKNDAYMATDACSEVIRLSQTAIQSDKQMGDAYVLLASALSSAASQYSREKYPDEFNFLHSRAAAVIQQWYVLTQSGSLTTKKKSIGEELWRKTVGEIKENEELPEREAIVLMNSCRRDLAASAVSPSSFREISDIIFSKLRPKR